ncbi:DEHA2D00110p [Debaryomyces hansenii CBS767]|uniref:DEHA2D00110p n=1 Tax=Debaryomyces hansenii (strain ATCC 36239 / CBS 767 / BCRC 21394 / JCM 1990 / NBRC 0083 / IGC 2968) TaxID=284592 RepID=Q6BTJ5_DEBHA|nr:DEHA2D00110p [Debaryomyces hansenii CBS767]CAG86557.2 DEHA2D00110p [Debaryomyces hansenii CBS767]|eukprot:XP_458474.2 DEHA2D00110p [Debaryomyces hansenii CBS767]
MSYQNLRLYFNVVSKCIDYCNVILALPSHSSGGRSLTTFILQSNFGLLGGYVNMVAAQEATYYIIGHSKKRCKGAINWEMDLSASGECENTGSSGGDTAKIWNNGGAQFLQLNTWQRHDFRKDSVCNYAIPNNGRGVCSEDGVLSYEDIGTK